MNSYNLGPNAPNVTMAAGPGVPDALSGASSVPGRMTNAYQKVINESWQEPRGEGLAGAPPAAVLGGAAHVYERVPGGYQAWLEDSKKRKRNRPWNNAPVGRNWKFQEPPKKKRKKSQKGGVLLGTGAEGGSFTRKEKQQMYSNGWKPHVIDMIGNYGSDELQQYALGNLKLEPWDFSKHWDQAVERKMNADAAKAEALAEAQAEYDEKHADVPRPNLRVNIPEDDGTGAGSGLTGGFEFLGADSHSFLPSLASSLALGVAKAALGKLANKQRSAGGEQFLPAELKHKLAGASFPHPLDDPYSAESVAFRMKNYREGLDSKQVADPTNNAALAESVRNRLAAVAASNPIGAGPGPGFVPQARGPNEPNPAQGQSAGSGLSIADKNFLIEKNYGWKFVENADKYWPDELLHLIMMQARGLPMHDHLRRRLDALYRYHVQADIFREQKERKGYIGAGAPAGSGLLTGGGRRNESAPYWHGNQQYWQDHGTPMLMYAARKYRKEPVPSKNQTLHRAYLKAFLTSPFDELQDNDIKTLGFNGETSKGNWSGRGDFRRYLMKAAALAWRSLRKEAKDPTTAGQFGEGAGKRFLQRLAELAAEGKKAPEIEKGEELVNPVRPPAVQDDLEQMALEAEAQAAERKVPFTPAEQAAMLTEMKQIPKAAPKRRKIPKSAAREGITKRSYRRRKGIGLEDGEEGGVLLGTGAGAGSGEGMLGGCAKDRDGGVLLGSSLIPGTDVTWSSVLGGTP